jgi:phytanoyl-CoA hydroxylase
MRTPSVATLWVALDDVDEQNGCLFHLPGSHLRGYRPHYLLGTDITDFGPADDAARVPICLRAGDVAVHHGATIHWAHANLSTRHRRAVQMVYGSVGCTGRDPASFLPLVSKNPDIVDRVLALLSP